MTALKIQDAAGAAFSAHRAMSLSATASSATIAPAEGRHRVMGGRWTGPVRQEAVSFVIISVFWK